MSTRTTRRATALFRLLALTGPLLVGALPVAHAQDTPPNEDQAPATQTEPASHPMGIQDASPALRRHIADQIARSARRRLLISQDPQPVEYRMIAELIAGARSLIPPDSELIRLEIEARAAGMQDDRVLELTRELLRVEPDDQVAQLRLAIATVQRRQSAEGRLEAYEQILGARGASFDKAVRSSLAVDAALLAREWGSERLFIDYLLMATSLDRSNKEAAVLFASHFLAASSDPLERADLLTNVVLSDPLDPEALQNLSLELVQHGAYRGAFALLQHTIDLYNLRREAMPLRMRVELTLAEWNTKGTDQLIDYTQVLEETLAQRIAGEREFATLNGLDPGPEKLPLLPLELEALRLAAAVIKRDDAMKQRMLDKCLQVGANSIPDLLASDPDPVIAQHRADAMRLTLLWCRAFAGLDVEGIKTELDYFTAEGTPSELGETAEQRFRGWLALLEGDIPTARSLLGPIVERDRHAKWAMGLLEEQHGDERKALRHFAEIAQKYPNTAIGTAAWFRTQELHGAPLVRSPSAEQLSNEGEDLVEYLQSVFPAPSAYMALEVSHVESPVDAMGGGELEITVRNRSASDLAIGARSPVPARVLATPILSFGTSDLVDATNPESFTLPGRLRLEPNEELTFRVRTTRRLVGDLLDIGAIQRSTVRWQLTLGFTHDGRRPLPTPFSISSQTRIAGVRALAAGADTEQLLGAIDSTSDLDRVTALHAAVLGASPVAMAQLGMDENVIKQRRTVLLNGIAARFPQLSELERAGAMLCVSMPMVRVAGPEMEPILAALQGERSEYIAAILGGIGAVRDLESPAIAILQASEQRWARDLATHLADTVRMSGQLNRLREEALGR